MEIIRNIFDNDNNGMRGKIRKWKTDLSQNIDISISIRRNNSHRFHLQDVESLITRKRGISPPEKN